MTRIAEYQQYAEECMRWATEAKSEEERKLFVEMARAWTQAALLVEETLAPVEQHRPAPPTSH
jgi:hypothetical protein